MGGDVEDGGQLRVLRVADLGAVDPDVYGRRDRADVQEEVDKILGQLPINSKSSVSDDKFLKAGNQMLNNAYAMAQFYDRDAPAEMASAGMKGFQEYMAKPDRREAILKRLEKVRQRVYK